MASLSWYREGTTGIRVNEFEWCGSPFDYSANKHFLVFGLQANIAYFGGFVEVVESVN
jgi:hypothetical protein